MLGMLTKYHINKITSNSQMHKMTSGSVK